MYYVVEWSGPSQTAYGCLDIGGAGWIWSAAGRMVAITFTFDPRPASHQVHRQLSGHFRFQQHSDFPGVLREWWGALCWLFFWSFASLTIKLYSLAPQHPGEPERVAVKIFWIYKTVVELMGFAEYDNTKDLTKYWCFIRRPQPPSRPDPQGTMVLAIIKRIIQKKPKIIINILNWALLHSSPTTSVESSTQTDNLRKSEEAP